MRTLNVVARSLEHTKNEQLRMKNGERDVKIQEKVSCEDSLPLGGIGVRCTPQSRYVVLRTSMPGRGRRRDRKTTQLPVQRNPVVHSGQGGSSSESTHTICKGKDSKDQRVRRGRRMDSIVMHHPTNSWFLSGCTLTICQGRQLVL